MNAVLGSLPLAPGDEVVITDMAYGAIALTAAAVCERSGAVLRTVRLDYPIATPPAWWNRSSLRSHRRQLVVIDHVTARTALVLPVAAVAAACHVRAFRCWSTAPTRPARFRSTSRRSASTGIGQPPQVGACASRVRDLVGRARAAVDAPLSGGVVGRKRGFRNEFEHTPTRIRRAIWRRPRA